MRKILLTVVLTFFTAGLLSNDASAVSVFMKTLKAKYEFKSVSCNTCHTKKDDIAEEDMEKFKEEPKHFRNDFGNLFVPLLKGKNVEERDEESSAAKKAARDADSDAETAKFEAKAEVLDAGLSKDFLEALEKVEAMKDASGKTYGELLKAGEIDGVRLPE